MDRNRHGETTLSWQDDLLVIEVKGPFNEEGQKYASENLKKTVLAKDLTRWRRLEILSKETLGSPAVLAMVKELYLWCEAHGCYVSATVASTKLQTRIIGSYLSELNVKVFTDVKSAEEWINSQH